MPAKKTAATPDPQDYWLSVIGRALAFHCLAEADLRDKGVAPQASFLEALGLSRKDTARLLGTTEASVTELLSRKRRKKGGTGRAKAKRT